MAIELLTKSANQGCAEGQHALGDCYYYSYGGLRDYKLAIEWYTKAAEQGYADAQCRLGEIYLNGNGISIDYDLAIQWFSKAVAQKHHNAAYYLGVAQYNLGQEYEKGSNGAAPDSHLSIELYTKAAESKWGWREQAMYSLGMIYKEGRDGVPQNYKLAAEWLEKASERGSESAQLALFDMYANGLGDLDYQRVVNCVTRANLQYKISLMYKEGREGVPQDYKLAAEWLEKAATQDHCTAQSLLGEMYQEGLGVPQDDAKAAEWFTKAAACK